MADFKGRNEEMKAIPAEENKNVETVLVKKTGQQVGSTEMPIKEIIIDEAEEKLDNIIKLSRTYRLDREEIDTIDLTKIEDLNAITMQKADNIYRKITKTPASMPETTYDYAIAVAHILTGYPVEFFRQISANDLTKIKLRVVNFLYSED